jgi:hypothetical protein
MAKDGSRSVVKPVAAAAGIVATMASIWWFALKPRRDAAKRSSGSDRP